MEATKRLSWGTIRMATSWLTYRSSAILLSLTEPFVPARPSASPCPRVTLALPMRIRGSRLPIALEAKCPAYLPGKNPFVNEYAAKIHVPIQAELGGAASMYPEFREDIKKDTFPPLAKGPTTAPPLPPEGKIEVQHVQGNVYMIGGAGGNIAVQVGDLGVLYRIRGTASTPTRFSPRSASFLTSRFSTFSTPPSTANRPAAMPRCARPALRLPALM